MRILICSANYAPEPTGVGKYSGEMAEWLASAGHEVRVVAAPPYYPAWRIADEYRGRTWSSERRNGVLVGRSPLWVPARQGGLQRVAHLLSFGLSSAPRLLGWALRWRPHVCIAVAPFLTTAPAALLAACLTGARSWLHIQDFELDVAFRLGLLRGSGVQRAGLALERLLFARFDTVSSISRRMLLLAAEKGAKPHGLVYLPNWVDVETIRPLDTPSAYRATLGLGDDAVVLLVAGTLGQKQGLQALPALSRLLAGHEALHLVVCGDGPLKAGLVASCSGLARLHFLPLQPPERMPNLLNLADIHLLLQDDAVQDFVLPSKLSGMLASGRPVVATCSAGSEVAAIVQRCGECVAHGDTEALARAVLSLATETGRRHTLGKAARQIALEHFARERVLGSLCAELER